MILFIRNRIQNLLWARSWCPHPLLTQVSLPCLLFLTHLFPYLWSRGVDAEICSPSPGQGEAQMGQLSKILCGLALRGQLPWHIKTVLDSKIISFCAQLFRQSNHCVRRGILVFSCPDSLPGFAGGSPGGGICLGRTPSGV